MSFVDYSSVPLFPGKSGCEESCVAATTCCDETSEIQAEAQEARSLILDCIVEALIRLGEIPAYRSALNGNPLAPQGLQDILEYQVSQKYVPWQENSALFL